MKGTYSIVDMAGEMPIGVQDFKKIRNEDSLYIDKSDMISQILSKSIKVYLYTRPRRFGKSLNLSMLDAFFNLKYPKDNKWFDGLKVSECEMCQKHRNAYPVINFDFKGLDVSDIDSLNTDVQDKFYNLYSDFYYLLDSPNLNRHDKSRIDDILSRRLDMNGLKSALTDLTRMLYLHHGIKVIVLLDEYDNPIHNSFGKPLSDKVLQFMKGALSSLLKGNEYLQFGVVTGVMQIAKESIFSGLNNLYVNNVLSKDFDESFGFTDGEVRRICEDNGHPEKYPEAKEWYDGYRFGDAEVYNPWSIINYVQKGFEPGPYWAGTSGNDILDTLMDKADKSVFDDLLSLSQGEGIEKELNPTVALGDLEHDPNAIYSLLVMSGYLSAVRQDDGYNLFIPNGEMYDVFGDVVGRYINRKYGNSKYSLLISNISYAILNNKPESIEKHLYNLIAEVMGSNMLTHEHVYQAFLIGLLMNVRGGYTVTAEMENGKGRYDIMLRSASPRNPNIVIELKRSDSESSLQNDAERALSQIMERDYIHGLSGETILYGISFKGKQPFIFSKTLYL